MFYCPFLFLVFNHFFIAKPEKYYLIRIVFCCFIVNFDHMVYFFNPYPAILQTSSSASVFPGELGDLFAR
ncbi:hypothetical protein AZ036_000841 [Klebsiella michiganensis]|uniref:Uncharacterized protein n=1 Tax=Klebsiella michiganensis TaxID=1134687 RepID=A0ABR5G966_9ENTR|nr:hypothetical protein L387_00738 [Klebsiella michiganensis]KLY28185.1 hypothetical protein SK91_04796 [Klebsiella michiganensis]OUG45091.1 hypothetical protein AZ036_000841 [Klebsiella michiganensis]